MKAQPITRCIIFLKDAEDKQLLKPDTRLYGRIIDSAVERIIIMTPYQPPTKNIPWIGIVQNRPGFENEQPLLINVAIDGENILARGFVSNQRIELQADIVYMAACYERTPFKKSEMDILWQSNVMIIGGGSGGSKIAIELARAGFGHITICDPQRIEFANISRHEGNLWDAGKPKTLAIAEQIYEINPAITVVTYFEDIFELPFEDVKKIFLKSNLVVAATDKTDIQLAINELTYNFGIPAVFGGCYEEARGGEVLFTLPEKKMPCLACLRAGLKQPQTNSTIDYSIAKGSDDYQGQPGLHAAIDFVTCVEIQICIGILLRNSKTSELGNFINCIPNFILIGGALGQGFYRFRKPFDIFFQPLSGPRKTCPVCQNYNQDLKNICTSPEEAKP